MLDAFAHSRLIFRISLLGAVVVLLAATLTADLAAFGDPSRRPLVHDQVIKKSMPAPRAITAPGSFAARTPTLATDTKTANRVAVRTKAAAAMEAPSTETMVDRVLSPGQSGLPAGRIGHFAVNLHNGPSKSAAAVMVLKGAPTCEWVRPSMAGCTIYVSNGSGRIYSSFLSDAGGGDRTSPNSR
jgi:hypothetical protein